VTLPVVPAATRRRPSMRWFVAGGLLVCLLLAGFVSSLASGSPDGLDSVTLDGCTVDTAGDIVGGQCAAQQARDSATAGSPLAGYGVSGVDGSWSTGLAGVVGVLVTLVAMLAVARVLARRRQRTGSPEPAPRGR
jgi:cobalt/nickel transport protein